MSGKHRRWHKRWRLDAAGATAEHDSGWRVRYTPEAVRPVDDAPPEIGGLCWTADGRRWIVTHDGGPDDLNAWLASQHAAGLRDQASIEARIARLMREAGALWVHYQERSR